MVLATATNRRMAGLQDEARRTGKVVPGEKDGETATMTVPKTFTDDDILETFAFDTVMTPARNLAKAAEHGFELRR